MTMLQEEITGIPTNQPWVKRNILLCEEMILHLDEFLDLCLNTARKEESDDIIRLLKQRLTDKAFLSDTTNQLINRVEDGQLNAIIL